MRFVIRLLINAVALYVASLLFSGIDLSGSVLGIIVVVLVFGIINAIIRPIVTLLSLPFII